MDEREYNFVIIQFADEMESVEAIRTEWAEINDKGEVTGALFPHTKNEKYHYDILKNNPNSDITWTNNGELWPVKKTFRFVGMYSFPKL